MSFFEACAKLATYLLCIGVALELSHRIYWKFNGRVSSMEINTFARTILSVLIASIPMATAIAITAVFVLVIDKSSLNVLGLGYDGESFTKVAYGAGIALSCVTMAFLFGLLFGFIQVRRSKLSEDCISCIPLFLGGLIDFFTAAVFEEIVFRGYVYYWLDIAWGAPVAILASSVIFAGAHLLKHPQTPLLFVINALLFGLLVAIARYQTGSLWLPIGLHFGWNVVSGPIFGLPCFGRTYERGMVISDVSGPTWLTGGGYSLDGGALGTLALFAAGIGLYAISPLC